MNHETRVHPFPTRPSAETVSTIADLGRGDLVFLSNLLNGFFFLERFGGDSGFEVGDKTPEKLPSDEIRLKCLQVIVRSCNR